LKCNEMRCCVFYLWYRVHWRGRQGGGRVVFGVEGKLIADADFVSR
jgi:hypothetical protein